MKTKSKSSKTLFKSIILKILEIKVSKNYTFLPLSFVDLNSL